VQIIKLALVAVKQLLQTSVTYRFAHYHLYCYC
jgi:hypothetical protein